MSWLSARLAYPDSRLALRMGDEAMGTATSVAEADYRTLRSGVDRDIAALRAAGIRAGDRIALETRPSLEMAIALLAQLELGVTTIPLNAKLGSAELGHVMRDAAPRLVRGTEHGASKELRAAAGERWRPLEGRDLTPAPSSPAPHDVGAALLLYTSGTTGAPKGACITADNICANLDALASAWRLTDRDRIVHALPLFHVHGLILGLLGALRVGASLHHVAPFSPEAMFDAVARAGAEDERAVVFAVPTMYRRMLDAAEKDTSGAGQLAGARLLISGSAGLPRREHDRARRLLGRGIHERYGLTETLINCAVPASGPPRPGYVGDALPGIELRRHGEDGEVLPPEADDDETLGEIAIRGPSVFAGYLNRPDATAAAFDAEGYFHTGDIAARAPDGAIRIVGRKSTDLIKTGGYRVGAGEVEACLLEHPAIAEAAVVGVPDDDLGERIEAFVVLREGETRPEERELIERVSAELTPHKRPRAIHFRDELPRNPMGKVQKRRLLVRDDPDGEGPS